MKPALTRHRPLPASAAGLLIWLAAGCAAQQPAPSASQPAVQDFSLTFDQPLFRQLLRAVAHQPPPTSVGAPPPLADWRVLAERPEAFRGEWITVEGDVGRNSTWRYDAPPLAELGPLTQLELYDARQPLACTVILTSPADDLPLSARLRVTGRFVLVRKYLDRRGVERYAALLVAPAPTAVAVAAPRPPRASGALGWTLALTGGLLLAWLMLRRRRPPGAAALSSAAARQAAPFSVADAAQQWATQSEPPQDLEGSSSQQPNSPNTQ